MAEEEKTEDQEQDGAPEAEAPEQAPEPEAEESSAEDQAEEAASAEDEEAPAEEAEEAPAEEQPAEEDEEAGLDWKARRRLRRSRQPVEARPQRAPQERQAEREQHRRGRAAQRRRIRQAQRAERGATGTGTPPAQHRANAAKVRQGVVVSDRADKTITVRIDIARRHPSYEKVVRRSRTLRAHDERNEAGQGDVVRVVETRPISRSKRWRLLEVVERAR